MTYGITPTLLRAIEAMYTNTRAKVVSPDGETELFDITAGVLQGDTLAPFLFIIVLDYALRKATNGKEEDLGFTIVLGFFLPKRCKSGNKKIECTKMVFGCYIKNIEKFTPLILIFTPLFGGGQRY